MKNLIYLFLVVILSKQVSAQGVTKFGQSASTSTSFVHRNGRIGSSTMLNQNGKMFFSCGDALAVTHTLGGGVAPESKSVNYGTITSSLSGASKCWITQNLGSSQQATSAYDATEASAGWYWQFNRKQGYKHDGTTRTPATVWITTIAESIDWLPANDPCTLELGAGWRIPTNSEWTAARTNGNLTTDATAFSSVLKLGQAGMLSDTDSSLTNRGGAGYYWSSTSWTSNNGGYRLLFYLNGGNIFGSVKSTGQSVRCLKD